MCAIIIVPIGTINTILLEIGIGAASYGAVGRVLPRLPCSCLIFLVISEPHKL